MIYKTSHLVKWYERLMRDMRRDESMAQLSWPSNQYLCGVTATAQSRFLCMHSQPTAGSRRPLGLLLTADYTTLLLYYFTHYRYEGGGGSGAGLVCVWE